VARPKNKTLALNTKHTLLFHSHLYNARFSAAFGPILWLNHNNVQFCSKKTPFCTSIFQNFPGMTPPAPIYPCTAYAGHKRPSSSSAQFDTHFQILSTVSVSRSKLVSSAVETKNAVEDYIPDTDRTIHQVVVRQLYTYPTIVLIFIQCESKKYQRYYSFIT